MGGRDLLSRRRPSQATVAACLCRRLQLFGQVDRKVDPHVEHVSDTVRVFFGVPRNFVI